MQLQVVKYCVLSYILDWIKDSGNTCKGFLPTKLFQNTACKIFSNFVPYKIYKHQ